MHTQPWYKLQEQNLGYVIEIGTQYTTYFAMPTLYEKGVVNIMQLKALAGLVMTKSDQHVLFSLQDRSNRHWELIKL